MDPVVLVIRIAPPEGGTLDPEALVNAAGKALDAINPTGETVVSVVQRQENPMAGLFSNPEEQAKVIPYQGNATLRVGDIDYMDVVGNDGKVLCSFDKPTVRRLWQEMNR